MKKFVAAIALALMAVFGTAAAANAADYPQPTGPNSVAPGGTIVLTFDTPFTSSTTFSAGLSGHLAAEQGSLTTASTLTRTVTGSGKVPVSITFPRSASGSYTVSLTGPSGYSASQVVSVTVLPADVAPAATLQTTGVAVAPALWVALGALVVGAGLVTVVAIRRRRGAVTPAS